LLRVNSSTDGLYWLADFVTFEAPVVNHLTARLVCKKMFAERYASYQFIESSSVIKGYVDRITTT
jgi:hypothetical protein